MRSCFALSAASLPFLLALGCSCSAPSGEDAARPDAPGLDAPGLDAPGLDAPALDAPALDAPGLDAPDLPGLDAPGLDAPTSLPDAGLDAGSPYDGGAPPSARHLYWVEGRTVRRSELDGSGVSTVLSNIPAWVEDIDYDRMRGRILLLDTLGSQFVAASSGADCATAGACTVLLTTGSPVTSFAVDPDGDRLFWSVGSLFDGASGAYGSSLAALADTRLLASRSFDGSAWDGAYGWVYRGESGGNLHRSRPDGSSAQTAGTTFRSGVSRVALDPVADRAYLIVFQPSSASDLARVDVTMGAPTLAVTNPIRLVSSVVAGGSIALTVNGVAFDVTTRQLFWRVRDGAMHQIWRGDADAAGATLLRSFTNDGQTGSAFSLLLD